MAHRHYQRPQEMAQGTPSRYKYLVIKNEDFDPEWPESGVHTSIFDCAENPSPSNSDSRPLFHLIEYGPAALQFLKRQIWNVNLSEELTGTGCKYFPVSLDPGRLFDGRVDLNRFCLVLKLANCNAAVRDVVGVALDDEIEDLIAEFSATAGPFTTLAYHY
ncbi:hypothetical protein AOL_s00097g397 [Orbilia oligospora ATCC 24927]|uniref:Uncharacterized protein n=2 Tax=Orbilia oligospora TaxID=2813651 RepID=G1XJ70_ARTOA|nr:hypothetical protein AOL_s00097g397 [Orbilia oligospora ATCC 24927]EGX46767.1 hypothetical protein AOL_s00097g397 [Orbilia oligospora ATCC 24927]KAF3274895.1 hypothetical protein TWF970_007598 [Orbilia oligospora]